jgi:hypothetical protein
MNAPFSTTPPDASQIDLLAMRRRRVEKGEPDEADFEAG